jgi:2-polyprenyl-6-methoxyphenol hydroxylase-like FAD-dependent oxidoreductase
VRPGHRAYNFVWYHPVEEQGRLRELCTDAQGRFHEHGIPPPLIRPQFIEEMRSFARQHLSPQFGRILDLTQQIFFQAIYDLQSPQLYIKRAAVLGDAAFVARPHAAMGVTKAAMDAESLADALSLAGNDIDAGLARCNQEQLEFGRRVVARARYLGAHLEAQHKPRELRTAHELSRDPQQWVRESGARLCDIPDLIEVVRDRRQRRDEEWAKRGAVAAAVAPGRSTAA